MILKVPWGSSWPIKISRNSKFYYMEKSGWDKFLSDNALRNDEFLNFTHKGNMCVSVDIYQIDGKEMLTPLKSAITASSWHKKREQGNNIYKDVENEEAESSSKPSCLGAKTVESTERGQSKKQAHTKAYISSLVPEFTISIKKAYLFFLGVPKKFAEMHMPKERKTFKIHLLNESKSWEVTYVVSDTQSRFSAGWIRLVKDLGLVVGDVCTFKLTKLTEMLLSISKQKTP